MENDIVNECPVCHSKGSQDAGTYGVFNLITEFLERYGWGIAVNPYTEPKETLCPGRPKHKWNARKIAGITFRRCVNCGLSQRRLYHPYFEDISLKITEAEWAKAEEGVSSNLRPYTLHSWH